MRRPRLVGLIGLFLSANLLALPPAAVAASAPALPGNVAAVALSPSQIQFSWSENSNQTNFQVTDGVSYVTLGASARSYTWSGLAGSTYKCSAVRAYNSSGSSAWTAWACTTTLPSPPAVPGNVAAVALSPSQIQFSWSEDSNQTGFQVTDGTTTVNVASGAGSYTWTGLAPNTYKCSRVRAYNAGGYSDWSNAVCVSTLPPVPDAPNNPRVVALSTSEIQITWEGSSNQTAFLVSDYMTIVEVGPDVRSYIWTGIEPDTWKCFKVQAINDSGWSDWSDIDWGQACTTTLPLPPAVPSDVATYALNPGEVLVAWTDDSSQTGFEVTDGVTTVELGPDIRTFSWTGLAPDTYKCSRVRAYNAGGYSDWSDTACTTALPAMPADVTAEALSTSEIRISWTASSTQDSFQISDGISTVDVGPGVRSYTWGSLGPETWKCFMVQAVGDGGGSGWSDWACAVTGPLAVQYLSQWQHDPPTAEDRENCGPTSVAMVVWYFGLRPAGLSDYEFIHDARTKAGGGTSGTSSGQLVAALALYGLTGHEMDRHSTDEEIAEMKSALALGEPVIAFVGGAQLGRGDTYGSHWVVVTGFSPDGSTVYVNDPDDQYGGQITLAIATFRAALEGAELGSSSIIVDIPS
jgi:hypothetical protein